MTSRTMELKEALAFIQEHNLSLCYEGSNRIEIWTPHTPIPLMVRRTVFKHRQQVKMMLETCDALVCLSFDRIVIAFARIIVAASERGERTRVAVSAA